MKQFVIVLGTLILLASLIWFVALHLVSRKMDHSERARFMLLYRNPVNAVILWLLGEDHRDKKDFKMLRKTKPEEKNSTH